MDGNAEKYFSAGGTLSANLYGEQITIVSYNLLSGVLRALGDSRTPLLYQFFGGIINVFADFIFLAVFHMGVEGTALATLFSQTVAAIGIMLHLYRLKEPYALRFSIKECSLREFTDILKVGCTRWCTVDYHYLIKHYHPVTD